VLSTLILKPVLVTFDSHRRAFPSDGATGVDTVIGARASPLDAYRFNTRTSTFARNAKNQPSVTHNQEHSMNQRTEISSNSSQLPFGRNTILLGASALVLYGLSRRSKEGLALATAGGALALKASKSHSPSHQKTKATFLVNASPERAYNLWRNVDNLPRFMAHLKSVRMLDERHSEWVAAGPMDRKVQWHAEVTEDVKDQRIAWKSLPGSDIRTRGSVKFRPDPQNRGTFVTAEVHYSSPGGAIGRGIATLLGKHPAFMVREDLRRFKALLETGETPTTVGQTHGPRGVHGHAEQVLFRETNNHPQPQASLEHAKSA
jgi:uncharacterized membrane protein